MEFLEAAGGESAAGMDGGEREDEDGALEVEAVEVCALSSVSASSSAVVDHGWRRGNGVDLPRQRCRARTESHIS